MNGRWEMDRWLEAGMNLQELFDAMTRDKCESAGIGKNNWPCGGGDASRSLIDARKSATQC